MSKSGTYIAVAVTSALLLFGSLSLPFVNGLDVLTSKYEYPYKYQWVYIQETLSKATPLKRAAYINALQQSIDWWRAYPKNMPIYLSTTLPDIIFEDGEDFILWWQSRPPSRDMVIYIVDDSLQVSTVECLNAIGNEEGTIFDGDASLWIVTQHIRCVNGKPYHQSWIPYAEFHDILKSLLGEGVGHSGDCPLGDLLGWAWECIFESIDDAEDHPEDMCALCWRWYTSNVHPLYN